MDMTKIRQDAKSIALAALKEVGLPEYIDSIQIAGEHHAENAVLYALPLTSASIGYLVFKAALLGEIRMFPNASSACYTHWEDMTAGCICIPKGFTAQDAMRYRNCDDYYRINTTTEV